MSGIPPVIEPTGKIAPQAWMTVPETVAVTRALTAAGAEVRFVGGCVRDAVARRRVEDIDIATPDPPARVLALLGAAGIHAIPTGIDHGTVTAVIGERHFEITTLRVDVETDGRRAKVAFTDDWVADAARRDFTINALSCTLAGDVYDPFGGLDDLASGRVRFVGNPRERIGEDVLRILRFFRFYAYYGVPPPDTDALAACRALASRLKELSGERVCGEMIRMLLAPDPAGIFVLMRGERVLDQVLAEAGDVGRLRMLTWLETRALKAEGVKPDSIRRLAALVDTTAAGAEAVAERLRFSNRRKVRLVALVAPPVAVTAEMDGRAHRRALQRLGAEAVRDLALLAWAGRLAVDPHPSAAMTRAWQGLLAAAAGWTPIAFPLKGRDALALGIPPGPAVGKLLSAVEAWWEEGDYRAGREECLAILKGLAGAEG